MEDLGDHRSKCRFCLGKIKSTRAALQITEEIKQHYFSLTSSKLKTSENYSSIICKICFGDLESSVGFQQKIIRNQLRLEKFDFDGSGPLKEEAVDPAVLMTEIKTECFEFMPSVIVESWPDPPKDEMKEPEGKSCFEEKIASSDVKDAPFFEGDSDEDFTPPVKRKKKRCKGNFKKENKIKEEKPRAEDSKRICPYCAESLTANGMPSHVEAHENKINNTPLICELCGYRCYTKVAIRAHFRARHFKEFPELAAKTDVGIHFASRLERRAKLLEAVQAHPKWSDKFLAKKFKITEKSVQYFKKVYQDTGTIQRKKVPGRKIITPLEIDIRNSFRIDSSLSHRQRARDFNVDRKKIERIAKDIGFKLQIDDSLRIHKCTICPAKYNALANLKSHVRRKHNQLWTPLPE